MSGEQLGKALPVAEVAKSTLAVIQDFMIDILGNFIPGLVFTGVASVTVAWSLFVVCFLICPEGKGLPSWDEVWRIMERMYWAMVLFFIVASYTMGCLFYREDIKRPDAKSAKYVLDHAEGQDKQRGAVREVNGELDVQWPYRFLREYLVDRGLHHLGQRVPWSGHDEDSCFRRSKQFINILKVRLQWDMPAGYREITRNEAHVRLMSSLWNAAETLVVLVLVCGVVLIAAAAARHARVSQSQALALGVWDVTLLGAAWWIMRKIRKFLHYMRVREIVYVLETAHWAAEYGNDVFKGFRVVHVESVGWSDCRNAVPEAPSGQAKEGTSHPAVNGKPPEEGLRDFLAEAMRKTRMQVERLGVYVICTPKEGVDQIASEMALYCGEDLIWGAKAADLRKKYPAIEQLVKEFTKLILAKSEGPHAPSGPSTA